MLHYNMCSALKMFYKLVFKCYHFPIISVGKICLLPSRFLGLDPPFIIVYNPASCGHIKENDI